MSTPHSHTSHAHSGYRHGDHHDDGHGHGHTPQQHSRLLAWATVVTLAFMVIECVGGWLANSLALIADAGHMFTDAAALGLAWAAIHIAQRRPDNKRSFGYHRTQVLATFVNGILLLAVVAWIAIEALQKFMTPTPVNAPLMLAVASIGACVNIVVFIMLRHGDHDDMNISAALLHVIGDLLGSIGAIIAALVIYWTGWLPIDPLLSLLLCGLIVRSAWLLVRKSSHILLEGAPDWLNVAQLRIVLQERVPEITNVHHVHCWSLSPRETLLTLHATVSTQINHNAILAQAQQVLAEHYGITHSTIQIEFGPCLDSSHHEHCGK